MGGCIACWVAELNATLFLIKRAIKMQKIKRNKNRQHKSLNIATLKVLLYFFSFFSTFKNFNVEKFQPLRPLPLGNCPGSLTTKQYVLINLCRNSYTVITAHLCCYHLV